MVGHGHLQSRRDLLVGGLLIATSGIGFAMQPRRAIVAVPGGDIADAVPMRVAGWSVAPGEGLVLPPEDERAASAVYEDEVARNYVSAVDPAVMFVLAYARSQSGMLMVHRPESCYPGSGFVITADREASIPLAPGIAPRGRFLSASRDERVEQVLYWTRLGDSFPQSWRQERRDLAWQNLNGFVPDGALVRVSMISTDPDGALAALTRFAGALFMASARDGRALLAGPAKAGARTV